MRANVLLLALSPQLLYEKLLVFYELDLGLNHVVRKWSDAVDPTANKLITVPGGTDGPGGVIVCSENFVVYKAPGQPERRCALPRRKDLPSDHGLLVTAAAVHKQRDLFFILVQSECGDLYKVTLQVEADSVSELRVRYLDSVPPCTALCILKSGFLFCASEFANHGFYQFQGVGEDEDSPSCSSRHIEAGDLAIVEIEPRPLQNLLHVDDIDSLCPIVDSKLVDPHKTGSPYIAALCGRGPRSSLRMLQHGLAVRHASPFAVPRVAYAQYDTPHGLLLTSSPMPPHAGRPHLPHAPLGRLFCFSLLLASRPLTLLSHPSRALLHRAAPRRAPPPPPPRRR